MGQVHRQATKRTEKNRVYLLFFQIPSGNILERIENFLRSGRYKKCRYFSEQDLAISIHRKGNFSDFQKEVIDKPPGQILIIGSPENEEVSQEFLVSLKLSGAVIKLIPVKFDLLSSLIQIKGSKDIPHIVLYPNQTNILNKLLKIVFNKLIALLGILFTLLVFPIIAIFIKSTSKGPIFYKQKRLGKNALPYSLIKFRTMYVSAEANGPQLSSDRDTRITKAGKILRYWHLDELPQFWNILKGDMALVGPRPERPYFAKMLTDQMPYYKLIYQEKPGLTSLGMIKYGYANTINEMTDRLYYDIVYLNNPSFIMDLKILVNTVRYIFLKTFYDPSHDRNKKREPQIKKISHSNEPLVRWLSLKNNIHQ